MQEQKHTTFTQPRPVDWSVQAQKTHVLDTACSNKQTKPNKGEKEH